MTCTTWRTPSTSATATRARSRLNANLAFWDGLDGTVHWPTDEAGNHPMTDLVLADFLVVDVTKPYVEHGSFLEIELAARNGRPHQTCGGRTLNDDVMDLIFPQLVNAGHGPTIRDGVDSATRPASRTFPYLAPPNPDPPEPPELTSDARQLTTMAERPRPASSSTTSSPARCSSAPRRTSAPICCCASRTVPTAGGVRAAPDRRHFWDADGRDGECAHRGVLVPRAAGPGSPAERHWTASPRSSVRGWQRVPPCWRAPVRVVPSTGSPRSAVPTSTWPSRCFP